MNILEIGIQKGMDEGRIEGTAESVLRLLEDKGSIPDELRNGYRIKKIVIYYING